MENQKIVIEMTKERYLQLLWLAKDDYLKSDVAWLDHIIQEEYEKRQDPEN